MRYRLSSVLIMLMIFILPVRAQEQRRGLAHKLPADGPVLYVEVDMQRLLESARKFATFVDEDGGEKLVYQVREFYQQLRKMSRRRQFDPRLFDKISRTRAYFVIIPLEEPEVRITENKTPKWDRETGKRIDGEFKKYTVKQIRYYCFSVLLEAPSAGMAGDFLQQVKMLLNRQKERLAAPDLLNWKQMDVEQGELLEIPQPLLSSHRRHVPGRSMEGLERAFSPRDHFWRQEDQPRNFAGPPTIGMTPTAATDRTRTVLWGQKTTLGRLGRYLVFSGGKPSRLWKYMMSSPPSPISDSPAYRRLKSDQQSPLALATLNIGPLLKRLEDQLTTAVEKAKKAYEKEGDKGKYNMAKWRLKSAQMSLKIFQVVNKLFSLPSCKQVGAGVFLDIQNGRLRASIRNLLSHDTNISPLLKHILDGSGKFDPPEMGEIKTAVIMGRLDPGKLYRIAVEQLRQIIPEGMDTFEQQMGQAAVMTGVRPDEYLKLMGADQYVFVDLKEKEVERRRWLSPDEADPGGKPRTETYTEKVWGPEFGCLIGLGSPQGFKKLLNKVFSAMSANQNMSSFAGKRVYQNTDVFCFGPEMGKEDKYPDEGMGSAFVVVNRYLSFGSWDDITRLIRRLQGSSAGTDPRLRSLINQHPRANLLVSVPPVFFRKIWKMKKSIAPEGEPGFFDSAPTPDPQLKKIWERLHQTVMNLQDKVFELNLDKTTAVGSHKRNVYRIIGELILRKNHPHRKRR